MAHKKLRILVIVVSAWFTHSIAVARTDFVQVQPAPEAVNDESATTPSTPVISPSELRPLGVPAGAKKDAASGDGVSTSSSGMWWFQTLAALVFVVGLIFVVRAMVQKLAGRSGALAGALGAGGRAPSGVLEVLGRYPVARGQSFVLLRLDRKILLLAQTAAGYSTLTEVSDPDDVASLVIKTRDEEGATNAARFNDLLKRMERDPSIIAAERGEEIENAGPPIIQRGHFGTQGVRA